MIPNPLLCRVIMVHYGEPQITQKAVAALWAGTRPPDQVIIIDHAYKLLDLPSRPQQDVIRPATNAGYAAGLNVGLGAVFARRPDDRDIVVCMNNDVLVNSLSLRLMLKHMRQNSVPLLIGARWGIVNPLTGRSTLLPVGSAKMPRPMALPYIDGAFMAAPWSVWWKLQKIPDDYFMYWEESALFKRLRQLNIRAQVLPYLDIKHNDSTTNLSAGTRAYYLVRNGAHYLQTDTPRPIRWWWRLYNPVRYLYHSLRGGRQSQLIRLALGDALRGIRGKQKLSADLL